MEERELETIAMLRNELAKKRKLAQESYKKSKTGPACVPVHSHKMPTMPQEFQFQTDTRVKSNHGMETRNGSRERDFAYSLRSGAATASVSIPLSVICVDKITVVKSNLDSSYPPKEFLARNLY